MRLPSLLYVTSLEMDSFKHLSKHRQAFSYESTKRLIKRLNEDGFHRALVRGTSTFKNGQRTLYNIHMSGILQRQIRLPTKRMLCPARSGKQLSGVRIPFMSTDYVWT